MTANEALRWLTDRALIAANGLASENVSRVSDELHDALTAKDAEIARLMMKNEQYAAQLDDTWAGVVGVTNKAVDELATLRDQVAALTEERDGLRTLADDLLARLTEVQTDNETLTTAHAALREECAMFAREILHDLPDKAWDAYETAKAQCAALAAAPESP